MQLCIIRTHLKTVNEESFPVLTQERKCKCKESLDLNELLPERIPKVSGSRSGVGSLCIAATEFSFRYAKTPAAIWSFFRAFCRPSSDSKLCSAATILLNAPILKRTQIFSYWKEANVKDTRPPKKEPLWNASLHLKGIWTSLIGIFCWTETNWS